MNNFNPEVEMILKIIMVGDSGVGKSCLLKSFMGEEVEFDRSFPSTIGVDFEIKPISLTIPGTNNTNGSTQNKMINLQIWDTAGQERFRTITTSYYRSSDAIMLVFDVSDETSFRNLGAWLQDVRLYARDKVSIMLLANKADLVDKRVIDFKAAKEFADANNLMYMETSAKADINVDKSFNKLATVAYQQKQQIASTQQKQAVNLTQSTPQQKQQPPTNNFCQC